MLQDGRLVISGIAVGVAMFALVWDYFYNFPLSRPVLIGCVTTYFILMAIHTLYTTFKEKGIFVVVMQKDPAGMDPDSTWEAASNMKKYDDKYELVLTYVDGKTGARRESTVVKSVGDYIDENGVICLDILEVNSSCSSDKCDLTPLNVIASCDEDAQLSLIWKERQVDVRQRN